jgi:hypothetical protein
MTAWPDVDLCGLSRAHEGAKLETGAEIATGACEGGNCVRRNVDGRIKCR